MLIVDDNADNHRLLREMLSPLGFAVTEAVDGRDALTQVETSRSDLMVMDLRMPEIVGFEALRRIRRLPDGQEVTVFLLMMNRPI